jgi:hypothetical protein
VPLAELILYYGCVLAGIIIVFGGILLLYKQKIYIDSASNQVTEIETPIGKFRTNLPVLGLFAVGIVALVVPLVHLKSTTSEDLKRAQAELAVARGELRERVVKGAVQVVGDSRVEVYGCVDERPLYPPWRFELRMPAATTPLVVITSDRQVVETVPISGDDDVGVIANVQAAPADKQIVPQLEPMPAGFR